MAKKISQLSLASSINGTDEVEINQGGTSKKMTVSQLIAAASTLTLFTDTQVITGSTVTLAHTPVKTYGYYIGGQKAMVGGRIVSIVGTLVTLDADYTGQDFEGVYEY